MKSIHSLLLASTAVLGLAAIVPAQAANPQRALMLAQAAAPADAAAAAAAAALEKEKREHERKAAPPAAKPAPAPAAQAPVPPPPAAQAKPPEAKPPAPAAQAPVPPPAAAQAKPPEVKPPAPAAQKPPEAPAPRRAEPATPEHKPAAPVTAQPAAPAPKAATPAQPPAAAAPPVRPAAPTAEKPADKAPAPAAQERRAQPPAPAAAQSPTAPAQPPAATAQPKAAPAAPPPAAQAPAAPAAAPAPAASTQPAAAPAIVAQPTKPRNANEFIRKDGQAASRGMDEVRKERQETRDGSRIVIREGDRTIVRDGNQSIIRHNEAERFSVGARNVQVDRRGNETISVILRPNGFSIVSITDDQGYLIRRLRRDARGNDIVIIDNSFAGARRGDSVVDLAPPVIRIPRDHYILDAGRATPVQIYAVFTAPPVERIESRYTLEQVRYSQPLRERMPRVDLDIHFETGSWQLSPAQIDRLGAIAQGLNRAIERNPREVFLIEGHTDAVGTDEDNLSLSDRRAEAVAVALTEQFQVAPENLVTQGYGEQYLKVATQGASEENRRVAVRRITPLMAQAQTQGGGNR